MSTDGTTLTCKQREMLDFILRFRERNGREPSLGQMARQFHSSKTMMFLRRKSLIARGALAVHMNDISV